MSSVVFLISMGFVIYFFIQGDNQDQIDRAEYLDKEKKLKRNRK